MGDNDPSLEQFDKGKELDSHKRKQQEHKNHFHGSRMKEKFARLKGTHVKPKHAKVSEPKKDHGNQDGGDKHLRDPDKDIDAPRTPVHGGKGSAKGNGGKGKKKSITGMAVGVRPETELYFIKRATYLFEKKGKKTTRYHLGGQVLDWFADKMKNGTKEAQKELRQEVESHARRFANEDSN